MSTPGADRICIGTAQFGMPYGIANRHGAPSQAQVTAMTAAALDHGAAWFDTAQDYGDAELKLGTAIRELGAGDQAQVITKLHPEVDIRSEEEVLVAVHGSLERLGVPRLEALLLHRPRKLADAPAGLERAVRKLQEERLLGRFGISAYRTEEVRVAREHPFVETFQVPRNVLDHRFGKPELFPAGAELYYRSVFLQGLLLMDEKEAARKLPTAREPLEAVHVFCEEDGLSLPTFLLAASLRAEPRGRLVLGAETERQIQENLERLSAALDPAMDLPVEAWERQRPDCPETLLNPALWNVLL